MSSPVFDGEIVFDRVPKGTCLSPALAFIKKFTFLSLSSLFALASLHIFAPVIEGYPAHIFRGDICQVEGRSASASAFIECASTYTRSLTRLSEAGRCRFHSATSDRDAPVYLIALPTKAGRIQAPPNTSKSLPELLG